MTCARCNGAGVAPTTVIEHHIARDRHGVEHRRGRARTLALPCSCTGPADEVDEMAADLERLVRRLSKARDTHSLHALDALLTRIRASLVDASVEVSHAA